MNFGKLILNYLWSLAKHWIPAIFFVGDIVWSLTVTLGNFKVSSWVYFVVFGLEFLIANFILYYKNQHELIRLKANFQKEIESLNAKIEELEDRIPKLWLFLKVGIELVQKQTITVKEKPVKQDLEKLIKEEQERLVANYESYVPKEGQLSHELSKSMAELTRSFVDQLKGRGEYDKECREYLSNYRSFWISKFNYDYGQARYRYVQLAVKNTGRTPGQEIILLLHFPDVFQFYSMEKDAEKFASSDFLTPPKKPTQPKVTQSLTDFANRLSYLGNLISPPQINTDIGQRNVSGPFISHHKSTEIKYEIEELIHNFTEDNMDKLYFMVRDEAIDGSWEIKYEIHAANLPTPTPGSLWIEVVEK